ncbi:MAG TPA: hypothetical protein VII16_16405 [Actinomycetes bacterium]|jgi:hypothetical protein
MPPAAIGETIYQRDYRIGSALKKISDENAGMSLLVNHHDRKAQADDFVDTQLDALGRSGAGAGDEDDPLAAPVPGEPLHLLPVPDCRRAARLPVVLNGERLTTAGLRAWLAHSGMHGGLGGRSSSSITEVAWASA